jgi:GNAT superfamily N-acetyltransferase
MISPTKNFIRDLGNGLILRRATPQDADALADFNAGIHGDDELDGNGIAGWTRDLLIRPHPTLKPDDFTIVEEPSTGRIVSSLNLIPQTWTYEGIEFGVGRPELVGTLPEFRGRGLVQIQFDEIHKWCAERGYVVQAITGIAYFYRQFGYEMALDLAGRRFGYESQFPKLKEGEEERYCIRPATEADLPFVSEVYNHAIRRHALACVRSLEVLKYELNGQSEDNINRYPMMVIEDGAGERVGYFQHSSRLGQTGLTALWYELKPGVSWLEVTPSVVRYLWRTGQEYARRDGKDCTTFGFMVGAQHPVYEALGEDLPTVKDPYAFYMRVPDLPGFLIHIKPALEKRLAESIAPGHSREIKISFYRTGLRIVIEKGKIMTVEPWKPKPKDEGDISFPDLTFLQMVFGYRNYDELNRAFADCWCNHEDVRILMDIIFPKKLSDVFAIE